MSVSKEGPEYVLSTRVCPVHSAWRHSRSCHGSSSGLGWRPWRKSSGFLLTAASCWLAGPIVWGAHAGEMGLVCVPLLSDPETGGIRPQESGLRKTKGRQEQAPPACGPSLGPAPDSVPASPLSWFWAVWSPPEASTQSLGQAGTPGYRAVPMCYVFRTFLSIRH